MTRIIASLAQEANIEVKTMPEGVRRRCTGSHEFIFNHNAEAVKFAGHVLQAADVLIREI